MKTILTIAITLLSLGLHATASGDELLASLHSRIKNNGDLTEIYDAVEELPNSELQALYKKVERAWPRLRDKYISNFQRHAKNSRGKASSHKKRIRTLRENLAEIRKLTDGPMKTALKKTGMPALEELRSLLLPNAKTILETADDSLKEERHAILAIAGFRDAIIEAAIIPNDKPSDSQITNQEKEITQTLSGLNRKGLRIISKNKTIAEKTEVPESERTGVRDLNLMRLLAGLNALEIDPKLCASGRDHSKDMETHGFFAHESPIPGKKNPFVRAKNFGTSASGENIHMGSTTPLAANKAWFFSPGHHRNMFNPGHQRIGLGQHNRHWTQLFGR